VTESAGTPVYSEPAGSYASSWVMFAVVAVAFTVDCARAGRLVHVLGWSVGAVMIVGVNVLVTTSARALRSITVTTDSVQVGSDRLARSDIAGVAVVAESPPRILGQTPHLPMPRGVAGLALRLRDGSVVGVPTRRPDDLAAALGLTIPDGDEPTAADDVRIADGDDLAQLADVEERAAALYRVAGLPEPPARATAAGIAGATCVLVAGRPVYGYAWLSTEGQVARVEQVAVVPGRVRDGAADRLRSAAHEWAAGHGFQIVETSPP
jgi:hypothetical protein